MTKIGRIPVRVKIRGVVFILLFLAGLAAAHSGIVEVSAIEVKGKTEEMSITLEFTEPVNYRSFTLKNPPRLVLDIPGNTLKEPRTIEVNNGVVETIGYLQYQPDTVRIVVNLTQPAESRVRKAGKKLLLYFSLSPEMKARLQTRERAKAKAEREMKKKLAVEERAKIKREKEEAIRLARAGEHELKVKEEERRLGPEREAKAKIRDEESRKRAEERAKKLLEQRVKRDTELKAKEAVAGRKLAEKVARREAKERKRNIEASLSQGEKHYRAKRFDEAIREFETVLSLDQDDEKARNYLNLAKEGKEAQLFVKMKAAEEENARWEEEQEQQEIRRREEEKEKNIVEHLNRGKKYYLQGRYAEAISEGEKVLSLSSGNRRAEELIIRSKRQALEVDKKKVLLEKEIVEARRTLDVPRAIYTSPVDYTDAINPEKKVVSGGAEPKDKDKQKAAVAELRETVENTPVKMNFRDTDLYDVITFLSEMSKVTIAIDQRALNELIDPNVSIYIPTEIPLTDALDLILKVKGLNYVIKENYILIAKEGEVEPDVTKTYSLKYGIRKIRAVTLTLPEEDME